MWFYVALATSLIVAASVIISKKTLKKTTPQVLIWGTFLFSTPIVAFFAIKNGLPSFSTAFIIGIIGSVLFYTLSKIIQFRAIKMADLSAIYPLISLSPMFTLFFALFPPINERPNHISFIGVCITLIGTYILNIKSIKSGLLEPIKFLFRQKASLLMIFSVILESAVVVFDKYAINNITPKNTAFVLLSENILILIILLPLLSIKEKGSFQQIIDNKTDFFLLGVLNAIYSLLGFIAVKGGNVGIVSTVFKAQLLFVLLFSFVFFKDKPKIETVFGSVIMIIGVIVIKFSM